MSLSSEPTGLRLQRESTDAPQRPHFPFAQLMVHSEKLTWSYTLDFPMERPQKRVHGFNSTMQDSQVNIFPRGSSPFGAVEFT